MSEMGECPRCGMDGLLNPYHDRDAGPSRLCLDCLAEVNDG